MFRDLQQNLGKNTLKKNCQKVKKKLKKYKDENISQVDIWEQIGTAVLSKQFRHCSDCLDTLKHLCYTIDTI